MAATTTNVTFFRKREINGWIPDVILEERHRDELRITEHPVERGASITDHAYKRPAELEMEMLFSTYGSGFFGAIGSVLEDIADPIGAIKGNANSNPANMYQALLELQSSRELINVVTGKRRYPNLLLESVQVITNEESENNLRVQCRFREIIIVDTQITKVSAVDQSKIPFSGNNKVQRGSQQIQRTNTIDGSIGFEGVPTT